MKRLVLCCDGTWNSADQVVDGVPCPTNVVRLAYRVAKREANTIQVIYYDQGVGTGNALDRWSGGAFGSGVEDNIFDAYRFLAANYEPGDELFLFGFSRGAFTARSIAGMIRKCGILRRSHIAHYNEALELYRSEDGPDDPIPKRFREAHALGGTDRVEIAFVGAWDTVGALGIPIRGLRSLTRQKHQFHDTELSGSVKRAAHALAIDERRSPFLPTTWQYVPKPGQVVHQVWFAGVHSDVGGGYPDRGLGDTSLDWMIQQAREAGLAFDAEVLNSMPLVPNALGRVHDSKTGLYWLTPGIDREIGVSTLQKRGAEAGQPVIDPTQSLHQSVLKRWDSDPNYRPPGLLAFLQRANDPRAQQ